jgi:5'-methylthioadenosine phosphorylase
MIGIIGGSGLYSIEGVSIKKTKKIKTPFGTPSDSYIFCEYSGREVAFLPRHGSHHTIPPHKINYRANIWGFKTLGVDRVISFGATGGIKPGMKPGTIVILDQIIDMTSGRDGTFFNGESGVVHIDITEPYCPELRGSLLRAGRKTGITLKGSGTYVCTDGPRLETKAEILFYSKIGADVVGMTAMPEAALAREAELCYAGIAVVTNYAAGIKGTRLTVTEVVATMSKTTLLLKELLREVLRLIPDEKRCPCQEAIQEARVS